MVTSTDFLPRVPGAGSTTIFGANSPEEQVRLQIDGDAYPRIVLDVPGGLVLTGNGSVPPAPIVSAASIDTGVFATQFQVDALAAALVGAVPFNPDEDITVGFQRYFFNGIYEAQVNLPANCPPLGIGDGSVADRQLLINRAQGWAEGTTGGGTDGALVVIHNDNDTGAGSLRQAIIDHKTAKIADPTHKTWAIFDKTFNVDGDGFAIYNITPATLTMLAGAGSSDFTLDGRGVDFTYNGGGTPGFVGVGAHPNTFCIGGFAVTDFTAGGNTTPTSNIIISCAKFPYNAGGEDGDNGFYDVFDQLLWCHHVFIEHCEFSNQDWETDGNYEFGWGATFSHASWCVIGPHDKSEIIIDNLPPGMTLPPGVSIGSPGPYQIWVDATTPAGRVRMLTSQDHCYKPHVADRSPYVKGAAAYAHHWNNWADQFGFYTSNINVPADAIYWGTDPTFGGNFPNVGGPYECGKQGQMRLDGCIVTPYAGATATAKTRGVFSKREGVFGFSKTSGMLYEGSTINDGGDHLPDQVTVPPYNFTVDPADATLKARLLAYAGAKTRAWKYIGPGVATSGINAKDHGTLLGLASAIDVTGGGVTASWDSGSATVTYDVEPATADPTLINLKGTALPAADASIYGKLFMHVLAVDGSNVPTNSQLVRGAHNSTLNVDEWEFVGGPTVPTPVQGQMVAAPVNFRPAGTLTTVTTTATSPADLSAPGVAAAWAGFSAASLDLTGIVPASRKVRVRFSFYGKMGTAGQNMQGALKDMIAGQNITDSQEIFTTVGALARVFYEYDVDFSAITTPLVAGATFTLRPQLYVGSGTATIQVGGLNGPIQASAVAL